MPVVHASAAPIFAFTPPGRAAVAPQITVRGFAAPSRGSTENVVWRMTIASHVEPWFGMVDREEIFFVLSGSAVATVDGTEHELQPDDVLIVPPHVTFGIGNPYDDPLEMIAVLPVGGCCWVGNESFLAPWTV